MKTTNNNITKLRIMAASTWIVSVIIVSVIPLAIAYILDNSVVFTATYIFIGVTAGTLALMINTIYTKKIKRLCDHAAITLYVKELLK
jgi:Na+/proline symporter